MSYTTTVEIANFITFPVKKNYEIHLQKADEKRKVIIRTPLETMTLTVTPTGLIRVGKKQKADKR